MLYEMQSLYLSGCAMQISEAGFFVYGSLWNAGDAGLSGKWTTVLLWRLYDCVYELLFTGVKSSVVFFQRGLQDENESAFTL